MEQLLTIGQLAHATSVPAKTIRYYEQVDVLPRPRRSDAGYRQYTHRDVHRLLFVRRARALGLSLRNIKTLTTALDSGSCGTMRPRLVELVRTQLHTVQQQIAEFQLLQQQLEQLVHRLQTAPLSDHAEGCRCLELEAVAAEQGRLRQPSPAAVEEEAVDTRHTLEPLTLLTATTCGDGSCGCGCGVSLVELSLPAPAAPPAQQPAGRKDQPRPAARR
jgi:DNA-binding transcriptional MerR regulator